MSHAAEDRSTDPELTDWLRLLALPGIGPVRARELLSRYGTPAAVLRARDASVRTALAALSRRPGAEGHLKRAAATIRTTGIRVLRFGQPGYPERLHHLTDPPILVFARGNLGLLDRPVVAVVGTRAHSEYGGDVASSLAAGLGRAGVVVVSGLARGIDARAHQGALATGTVAVLGTGVDVVYPKSNARLHDRIAARGLLLSEFLPGEGPTGGYFPRRNRLIAALALGVVVVEAPIRSGALITARHAADLGREVMAVPGRVDRRTSVGTNALLRDGAGLVTGAEDVLHELGLPVPEPEGKGDESASPAGLDRFGASVWRALRDEPQSVDAIAARARAPAGTILTALMMLELDGLALQLPGQRYRRPT